TTPRRPLARAAQGVNPSPRRPLPSSSPLAAAGAHHRSSALPAVRAAARPFLGNTTAQREDDDVARDGWGLTSARREASDLAPPWLDP
ncbi:Os07g0523000, partial [Oryza sativa Japonica Group]